MAYHDVPTEGRGSLECTLRMSDERTLLASVESTNGELVLGRFSIAFAPDMTPPSVWARPVSWDPERGDGDTSWTEPRTITRVFTLPALVSLPDFGLVQVEADHPGATLAEELVPDPANAGLNHGWSNASELCARKAYHHGQAVLRCSSASPRRRLELCFTVRDEIEPGPRGAISAPRGGTACAAAG